MDRAAAALQAGELRARGGMVCTPSTRVRGDVLVRTTLPELLSGVALDLAVGDPRWLPHPVRAFGRLAECLEPAWRAVGLPLRISGVGFSISAVAIGTSFVAGSLAYLPRPWTSIYWIFTLLAIRDL